MSIANAERAGSYLKADGSRRAATPPHSAAGARPSEAGARVFVGYPHGIGSEQLATRLRETASVLVAPGVCFGIDGYLRSGFGGEAAALRTCLDRLGRLMADLPRAA